jgi:hypothetical protein
MAGELRKPEINEPVQLPHPVPKVLPQTIAEPDQLAQLLRRLIRQPAGRRPFLRGEARNPHRIDRVARRQGFSASCPTQEGCEPTP